MYILVVDDQGANRGLLGYMLEDEGHSVVGAADGFECLSKFESGSSDLISS
ncbi:MAG: CheY-like chemotaxis protein [Candidatus Azotimanducaceae bacterium]